MRTRSTIARGAATLALVLGVVATTSLVTTAPAYAATKKNNESSGSTESNQELTDKILNGIHFAADAADFVVPIVVNVLHPEN